MYTDDAAFKEYLDKMNKTIEALESQFATVRAGRANPAVLNHLRGLPVRSPGGITPAFPHYGCGYHLISHLLPPQNRAYASSL